MRVTEELGEYRSKIESVLYYTRFRYLLFSYAILFVTSLAYIIVDVYEKNWLLVKINAFFFGFFAYKIATKLKIENKDRDFVYFTIVTFAFIFSNLVILWRHEPQIVAYFLLLLVAVIFSSEIKLFQRVLLATVLALLTTPFLNELLGFASTEMIRGSGINIAFVDFVFFSLIVAVMFYLYENSHQTLTNMLMKSSQELIESKIQREELFTFISHEIRTPLNLIKGNAKLVEQEYADKIDGHYLSNLGLASDRLTGLVNDMLDMSMIERNEFTVYEKATNIRKVLNNVAEVFRLQGVDVQVTVMPQVPEIISVDKERLTQILSNSVSLLSKITNSNVCKIYVDTIERGENVLLTIKVASHTKFDGPEQREHLENIVEKFDDDQFSEYESALNVSVTKKILRELNGQLNLRVVGDNELVIDLSLKTEVIIRRVKNKSAINKGEPVNILIVEDNQLNSVITEKLILSAFPEAKIYKAFDGQQAVDIYKENPNIQVILMDLMMPVKDGYKATQEIRELPEEYNPNVPIIALSANVSNQLRERCLDLGMDLYLTKPIELDDLVDGINNVTFEDFSASNN